MKNFTALIIDDEYLARYTLRLKLNKYSNIDVIGEAGTITEAIQKINKFNPELLFLDIQLADGTGFDLINKIEFTGKIIFITAFDEFALRAFEINAIDYLLKPISSKRLNTAIERLGNKDIPKPEVSILKLDYNDRLMVTHNKCLNFIKINTITSITASNEYSYVHTSNGKEYLTSKSMINWEQKLPENYFCRIHRSTIINFEFIVKINSYISGTADLFIHGSSVPLKISRKYFRKLKEIYGL